MTQEQALKIMKTGVNIYLTGSAGSGKTFLLNQYISYLQDHNIPVAVTASTGIAATHMNGMTIHSWSGIGIRNKIDERDLEQLEEKKYLWARFEKARVLIIDEVSMLHGYQLDMIEKVCRRFKRVDKPFGGLQVILSGDFFQLPPVDKYTTSYIGHVDSDRDISPTYRENKKNNMVYNSFAWQVLNPAICYLSEQHRQDDNTLTEILNSIRDNNLGEKHYEYLNSRINIKPNNDIKVTRLYTNNVDVDHENQAELSKIKNDEKIYYMISKGSNVLVEILKKSCLAHEELHLKIDAEVMFIKNNFEEGYVNGSRGKVIDFEKKTHNPIIKLYNGKKVLVTPELWTIEEDGKIKASISQLPIRLAWAITIHKSQGMSLDNALIDLRSTFSYGMGYVALSRVRNLSGINLLGFSRESLQVDPDVLEYDQELKNESTQNELIFRKLKNEDQKKMEEDFIKRMGGTLEASRISHRKSGKKNIIDTKTPTIIITKELLEKGNSIKQIAKERNLTPGTITHHIEEIIKEYPETDISHIRPRQDYIELVRKVNKKLKGEEIGKLSPIKIILEKEGHDLSFEDIRLARLFI